jgi:beta-mannosidase
MNRLKSFLILFCVNHIINAQQYIELKDNWNFSSANENQWRPAEIPGNIFNDLERQNIIQNPLLGTNEKDAQWVSQQDWEYKIDNIQLPELKSGQHFQLTLPELDTYADIYWNNQFLMRTDNAFRTWKVNIPQVSSINQLRIYFHSPYKIAREKLKNLPYPLPGDSIRAVTRKPQYQFGWDWGPSLAGCGIKKQPLIEIINEQHIIQDQLILPDQSAEEACYRLKFNAPVEQCEVTIFHQQSDSIILQKTFHSATDITCSFLPLQKKLWQIGRDNELDTYIITVYQNNQIIHHKKFNILPRGIELSQKKDKWGKEFYFLVNGQKTFMKGANYIPIKFFHEQATEEDYKLLIERCKESNINMLRVWGGGIYEPDIFYDLCDKAGIMVWQDFMFACSMYPGDEGYLANLKAEVTEQVQRLSHHPCMALWCGNNENSEGWERWGWQIGLSDKRKNQIQKAYNDVFLKLLPNTVSQFAQTPYWPSSPLWGRGDERSLKEGDCHYWGVWHDAENFEVLMTKIPRFMSEFGMQSYPNKNVLNEMCTKGEYHPKDPGIVQHQKHNRGFSLMHQYMQYWHPTGEGLNNEQYALLTQYVQAEGMTMGIEAQRRHMDKCGGTMFWQLNDVWPSFSWSAMDWHFQPKPFLTQLNYAYAPFLASGEWNGKEWHLYLINEDSLMKNAMVKIQYYVKDALIKDWFIEKNIEQGSHVVFKTKEISHQDDAYFVIECRHTSLPNAIYRRQIKSKGFSKQFMVPAVENEQWICKPLFKESENN